MSVEGSGQPQRGLRVRSIGENFTPVVITHLVNPYLPKGKCVLFDADGGVGKTTLCAAWAAALSRGLHPLTFERLPEGPQKTLYLHKGEDSDEEIETVYRANKGVPGFLIFLHQDDAARLRFDDKGLRLVRETICATGAALVISDALFYFLEGVVGDGNKAMDAAGVLTKLNRIASDTDAVFWNVRHTVKGQLGAAASNLGMGSVQFRNSHRGQIVARWHPTKKGVVVVTDEKGSLLNARGEHFMYRRVEGNEVQYVQGPNPFEEGHGKGGSKLEAAKQLLRERLTGQFVPTVVVMSEGEDLGIGKRTMMEARAILNVQAAKHGESWVLHIPEEEEGSHAEA